MAIAPGSGARPSGPAAETTRSTLRPGPGPPALPTPHRARERLRSRPPSIPTPTPTHNHNRHLATLHSRGSEPAYTQYIAE